jgi:hypothetical protein
VEGGVGIAVDQGGLQRQTHGAHLHLHLGGAGLRALQVNDRAVHVDIAAEEVHGLGLRVDNPVALLVALVHSPEADRGELLLDGVEEAAAGDVHERQPREQFPLAEGLDHRQVLQAGLGLFSANQWLPRSG